MVIIVHPRANSKYQALFKGLESRLVVMAVSKYVL